jgi:hypothetical protein
MGKFSQLPKSGTTASGPTLPRASYSASPTRTTGARAISEVLVDAGLGQRRRRNVGRRQTRIPFAPDALLAAAFGEAV